KNHSHLFFDDHAWEMYMNSLKPLGLSILLNTCNLETIEQYTEFADHVSCMSHKHKEAIPVVNRRCFCELTRQIGFGQNAKEIFQTQNVYGIYQHVDSRCSSEDKSHTEKYKMPMPSMFCVAVKDLSTNTTQLFSQGMADILLNLCTDYWDGQNVQPLAEAERKKIADFYHRTSMTSYCTAFSYRPLEDVSLSIANDFYYEIPEAHFLSRNHDGLLLRPNYHEFSGPSYVDSDLKCYSKQPFKMLNNQIFIGMVTMQYQAKQEVVNLIENLESSCIRFVHFSKENELRSRVFSEKMGLEAGWNCHISLLTDSEEKQLNETSSTLEWQKRVTKPFNHSKSGSAPHINMYCSQYHADNLNDKLTDSPAAAEEYDATKSLQKNRSSAKLPKGIENIRPHINNIDNVPLQVSLFTDCSTSTTCEMLKILQEYGEVTCCLGSSLNIENFSIFLQADCSISIHPIYPYLCLQKNEKNNHLLNDFTSPFGLSSYMISLPCSLLFNNCSLSRMPKLIAEAQKHCQRVSSAAHLYLSLQMSLVLLQLMTTLFFLPPCLTAHQVTWLSLFVVPLISFSMMNNPSYSQIPNNLQGKNRKQLLNQTFFVGAFSFLVRFVPTIAVCLLCFALNLRSFCVNGAGNSTVVCHINFGCGHVEWMDDKTPALLPTFKIFLIYFSFEVVISYCNIHHLKYFWRIRPKENVLWCFICPVILVVQASWFTFLVVGSDYEERSSLSYVSALVWPVSLLWVIGIITIHELVKRKEMKIWIRHQKRAKLDFGTKLGMNSPF
ncbi:hypothetical protein HELRODRAFT_86932, partial [Helobdella robusta]|uniref:Cation-transporting P-type ATPase C-terminal domain-containing protein n=1 Tax=Helobdella robusta TaxID=6412 RepID=T1G6J3_HELRO